MGFLELLTCEESDLVKFAVKQLILFHAGLNTRGNIFDTFFSHLKHGFASKAAWVSKLTSIFNEYFSL